MGKIDLGPLVFGTLPMGPLQADLELEAGARLIARALDLGVRAVDSAEMYGTYPYIARAMELTGKRPLLISKTHADTPEGARAHLHNALKSLGVERLDVFNIHGARLEDPFAQRGEVIAELVRMKEEGLIGHVGLSTHRYKVVELACRHPEIEVLHPLINLVGLGIIDGRAQHMAHAIERASAAGKTVYAMKALAGGNLISEAFASLGYVRGLPGVDSVAVGMLSPAEVEANAGYFLRDEADREQWKNLSRRERKLVAMAQFCVACGACIEHCASLAISLKDGRVHIDEEKCVLCGYCAPACPAFLLRIV